MLTNLKNRIRQYFGFSASETNGLLVLIPILILILSAPSIIRSILESNADNSDQQDQKLLADWLIESQAKLKKEEQHSYTPTFFDPNNISSDKWIELGFKEKIAKRILNYRQKGGSFKKKEDLLKIYGINQKLVTSYFDYIIIPQPEKIATTKSPSLKTTIEKMVIEKESVKFDLNLSDSSQLQIVKGIGPVLSSRVIKYRNSLGGFVDMNQLKEVYGIEAEVYQRMLSHFTIIIPSVKKINVNQDSIKSLSNHPYISYKLSKAIIKYRAQHGDYQSLEELKKIYTLSDSVYQKIAPYLEVSK